MTYGIEYSGFRKPTIFEIKAMIEEQLLAQYPDADISAQSIIGQIIGCMSKPNVDLWDLAEILYNSVSPLRANGVLLDLVVSLIGINRLQSLAGYATMAMRGVAGTTIPQGSTFKSSVTGKFFETNAVSQISKLSQSIMFFKFLAPTGLHIYEIAIGGRTYSYADTTADGAANAMVAGINADGLAVCFALKLSTGIFQIYAKATPFDTVVTDALIYWYSSVVATCTEKGSLYISAGSITIVSPVISGLTEVINFEDGSPGREVETDSELRARYVASIQQPSAGTLSSIVGHVQNDVAGVSLVRGYENRTDATVGSMPPHSLHIVVSGGNNIDIANTIWAYKGAGIGMYGTTSVNIVDVNGDVQAINFSRPTLVPVWLKITMTYYTEESFPADGIAQVTAECVSYGNALQIGNDVIPQKFNIPIYSVKGISTTSIELSLDGATYVTTALPMSVFQRATFEVAHVIATIS